MNSVTSLSCPVGTAVDVGSMEGAGEALGVAVGASKETKSVVPDVKTTESVEPNSPAK